MDWTALFLSLRLAGWTVAILLPVAILAGRWLAYRQFRGKGLVEAIVMLPLVLPPTVFGFYLLLALGRNSPVGAFWQDTFGHQLVFTFEASYWLQSSSTCHSPFNPLSVVLNRSRSRCVRQPPVAACRPGAASGELTCLWRGLD